MAEIIKDDDKKYIDAYGKHGIDVGTVPVYKTPTPTGGPKGDGTGGVADGDKYGPAFGESDPRK